jgi:hypothetical protein
MAKKRRFSPDDQARIAKLLREIRDEVRALRLRREQRRA